MQRSSFLAIFLSFLVLLACEGPVLPSDGGADAGVGADAGPGVPSLDCEGLVPEVCAYPFPSNYFLAVDPSTPTGHRVRLAPGTLPLGPRRRSIDPAGFNVRDGFSVNGGLLAYLPGATQTGLPRSNTIERSLEPTSPTVLLDAETLERVPHFAELDMTAEEDTERALIIRQVVPLAHGRRYIVAIRGVVNAAGQPIAPSDVFRALRDGEESDHPYVAVRREALEAIFARLGDAGIARGELQLAWDFSTGSLEEDTARMLHMRDTALAAVGVGGPSFVIDSVEEPTEAEDATVFRRIRGRMSVPLFLDVPGAGGRLVIGPGGMPQQNGMAEYPFLVILPRSATPENPAAPLQIGHGLLGSREQANAGFLRRMANDNNFAIVAVDLVGMAEDDVPRLVQTLSSGQMENFADITDRLHQGLLNFILAMRMMRTGFGDDPAAQIDGQSLIDTTEAFYFGGSQGGIFGGSYMALSTDVLRGILGVPGQPYNILLNRSIDYDIYDLLMRRTFRDGRDRQTVLSLMQLLWDRTEPGSYTRHIRTDPLAGTPAHEVLMLVARGDQQVTNLGAHIMARAIGAPSMMPAVRSIFGVEEVASPHTGSAMIEFDFGLDEEPVDNLPATDDPDPHGAIAGVAPAMQMSGEFLRTGVVTMRCDGTCNPD